MENSRWYSTLNQIRPPTQPLHHRRPLLAVIRATVVAIHVACDQIRPSVKAMRWTPLRWPPPYFPFALRLEPIRTPVNRRRSVLRHVSGCFTTLRIVTLGASGDRRRYRHGRSHLALAPVPSSSSGRRASHPIHQPPLAIPINWARG
jgi:hypothetical protein